MTIKKCNNQHYFFFLPHGWRTEVAKTLSVHPLTISRNVKRGRGLMYDKIVKTVSAKYGKRKEIE
jgi:IS30 family transposase